MTITARITGRGIDSTVPDNDGAVDAEILIDGKHLCDVTLLSSRQDGALEIWGDPENWCSNFQAVKAAGLSGIDIVNAVEMAEDK